MYSLLGYVSSQSKKTRVAALGLQRCTAKNCTPGRNVADVITVLHVARLGRKLRCPLRDSREGACTPAIVSKAPRQREKG